MPGQNLKNLVLKGIDAIGNTASNIASSTKQKVNELSLKNQRSEMMEAFAEKVYQSWKDGLNLPEDLAQDLDSVMKLDNELDQIRDSDKSSDSFVSEDSGLSDDDGMQNPSGCDPEPSQETKMCPDQDRMTSYQHVPVIELPREKEVSQSDTPLSDAIDSLFENKPQMDQMAERINTSLDEMGKQLVQFSSDLGKQISDMADGLMNKSDGND